MRIFEAAQPQQLRERQPGRPTSGRIIYELKRRAWTAVATACSRAADQPRGAWTFNGGESIEERHEFFMQKSESWSFALIMDLSSASWAVWQCRSVRRTRGALAESLLARTTHEGIIFSCSCVRVSRGRNLLSSAIAIDAYLAPTGW